VDSATFSRAREDARDTPPILVVDDVADQAAATAATLTEDGYPTLAELDGDATLRQVRARLVRLVVSELYVPCSEGRCVVTCLKQERGRLPHLRVLVHTRHTTEADRDWALDAGCDGIVPKTAPAAVLLREVRRLDVLAPPHALRDADLGVAHGAEADARAAGADDSPAPDRSGHARGRKP
jgi:CheY-like chemotaxis protein